jgi:hypothetical protein
MYESVESSLNLAGMVELVWVDCFSKFPLNLERYSKLREAKFKLCLVSPELQGRNGQAEIPEMGGLLSDNSFVFDAVCTKLPHHNVNYRNGC